MHLQFFNLLIKKNFKFLLATRESTLVLTGCYELQCSKNESTRSVAPRCHVVSLRKGDLPGISGDNNRGRNYKEVYEIEEDGQVLSLSQLFFIDKAFKSQLLTFPLSSEVVS